MKINYLETELSPIGFLARDSLSGVGGADERAYDKRSCY